MSVLHSFYCCVRDHHQSDLRKHYLNITHSLCAVVVLNNSFRFRFSSSFNYLLYKRECKHNKMLLVGLAIKIENYYE